MTGDEIVLTLPAERDYYGVAHLVIGGLAVRLNLTFESLEDLQLALDGLLEHGRAEGDVTISVRVAEDAIELKVGPFEPETIQAALERDVGDEEIGLRRLLGVVVDRIEVGPEDARWVVLGKAVAPLASTGGD